MQELDMGSVDFAPFQNREEYLSVVITYAQNPQEDRHRLLENCLNSIHEHADYPFEAIVVDDTDTGLDPSILHVKNRVSTFVMNTGPSLRLCVSANRGVKMASSRYVVLMEDDTEVTRPCFAAVKDVLSRPYVGFLNAEGLKAEETLSTPSGTEFAIGGGIGGAWFLPFRKEVWREVGGLPEWSHQAKPPFCHAILKHGYWRAYLTGPNVARNVDHEDHDQTRTTGNVFDTLHFPRVFGMPQDQTDRLSKRRFGLSLMNANEELNTAASESNTDYWRQYHDDVTGDLRRRCVSSIDWEAAERHGQAQWRSHIETDSQRRG